MHSRLRSAPFLVVSTCITASLWGFAPSALADPLRNLSVATPGETGHVKALRATHPAAVEARARLFVGIRAPASSALDPLRAMAFDRVGNADLIVLFAQMHGGLPVIGRGAAVRMSRSGDELLTSVDLEGELPSTDPSLSAGDAAAIGAGYSAFNVTREHAHLAVWPLMGGGARLAYLVLPSVPVGVARAPRIIVDAQTGHVLDARDLVQFAKAEVFRFNPTSTPQLEQLELALAPGKTLSNPFLASYNCIDRKTVREFDVPGGKAKIHVCDIDQLATADEETGDFLAYPPSDLPGEAASRSDAFSELSMYYHAAKAYDFFRQLQGDSEAQVTDDKPLRVVANLQTPAGILSGNIDSASNPNTALDLFSNAFFSPAGGGAGSAFEQLYGVKGGGLWFGQGPRRDYAYDGDVVYHEFTHAVVDHSLKLVGWHVDARGAIDSPGAMNEALADYFSSAMTGDPNVGEYASQDLSQSSTVIRTLANDDACPQSLIGEVHYDSTLFSGALWTARTSLQESDRRSFDAALYRAMRTSAGRGDLGFEDLAKLFLVTLEIDLPAGAKALEASMTTRGILPACERIFETKKGLVKALDPSAGGFASPGLESLPVGELAPGMIQIHQKVSASDANLEVSLAAPRAGSASGTMRKNGTSFAPVALVKFGKPVTWTVSRGVAAHDADKAVAMSKESRPSAHFAIPEGTTDAYVQIANKGDADGAYNNVKLELSAATVVAPPKPSSIKTPVVPPSAESTSPSKGCSASPAPSAPPTALGGIALAAFALAAAFRRRRVRRSC